MRMEFQRALCAESDLDGVMAALVASADAEHRRVVKAIERDHMACKLIQRGLQEPQTSEAFRVAQAFMDDYRKTWSKQKGTDARTAEIIKLLKGDGSELKIDDDADGGVTDGTAEPGKAD